MPGTARPPRGRDQASGWKNSGERSIGDEQCGAVIETAGSDTGESWRNALRGVCGKDADESWAAGLGRCFGGWRHPGNSR
jgi:hypothetical protein